MSASSTPDATTVAADSNDFEGLLAAARERLREREDENQTDVLGDDMTPEPGGHFGGRWRGVGAMHTKTRGKIDVYLVWDRDARRGFLYQHAGLVEEVETENPQLGDEVVVLRGETREYEQDGEQRKKYPYALKCRPSGDPLPEGAAPDDLPF